MQSFTTFSTAIGRCGLGWNDRGVTRFRLPEGSAAALRAHLGDCEVAPAEAPAWIRGVIATVERHLRDGREDLATIPLDLTGVPPFHREVYEAALKIPAGKTVTYGELAAAIGNPGAARAVGVALGRNPIALIVPCHRIVAASAGGGGFSAFGGLATKRVLLERERAIPRSLFPADP